jgi:hypothetical protein
MSIAFVKDGDRTAINSINNGVTETQLEEVMPMRRHRQPTATTSHGSIRVKRFICGYKICEVVRKKVSSEFVKEFNFKKLSNICNFKKTKLFENRIGVCVIFGVFDCSKCFFF